MPGVTVGAAAFAGSFIAAAGSCSGVIITAAVGDGSGVFWLEAVTDVTIHMIPAAAINPPSMIMITLFLFMVTSQYERHDGFESRLSAIFIECFACGAKLKAVGTQVYAHRYSL